MKKILFAILVLFLLVGCGSPIDDEKFSKVAMEGLYNHGFCYEGQEAVGELCGEADYPFVRVFDAEDYTDAGEVSLAVKVGTEINQKMPETKSRIVFIFRDRSQRTIDRIYWENGKWSR